MNMDKLPEMTFKAGDKVWTPTAGFCVLTTPDMCPKAYPLWDDYCSYTTTGRESDESVSRIILTLEEATKLGLKLPVVKRKERRYAWISTNTQGYSSIIFTPDELGKEVSEVRWTRAPWLDGEVEVEDDE